MFVSNILLSLLQLYHDDAVQVVTSGRPIYGTDYGLTNFHCMTLSGFRPFYRAADNNKPCLCTGGWGYRI